MKRATVLVSSLSVLAVGFVAYVSLSFGSVPDKIDVVSAILWKVDFAIRRYYLDNAKLPPNLAVLKAGQGLSTKRYLEDREVLDPWGNQVRFSVEGGSGKCYRLEVVRNTGAISVHAACISG